MKGIESAAELRARFQQSLLPQTPTKQESNRPSGTPQYNQNMDSVTRYELDAKIEALEARLEGKVSRIETSVNGIKEDIKGVVSESQKAQAEFKSLKQFIVATAVATVMGIAAFNATVLSNMLSAFESGKNTASAIEKASAELKETKELVDKVAKQLEHNAQSQMIRE